MEYRMTDIEKKEWEDFGYSEYHGMLCDYVFKDENLGWTLDERYYAEELEAQKIIDANVEGRLFW